MEKWNAYEVLNFWQTTHKHKYSEWNAEWTDLFINHPDMETILKVDASWIRDAIREYSKLSSAAWQIKNKLEIEKNKNDPSGLYSPSERGWW